MYTASLSLTSTTAAPSDLVADCEESRLDAMAVAFTLQTCLDPRPLKTVGQILGWDPQLNPGLARPVGELELVETSPKNP